MGKFTESRGDGTLLTQTLQADEGSAFEFFRQPIYSATIHLAGRIVHLAEIYRIYFSRTRGTCGFRWRRTSSSSATAIGLSLQGLGSSYRSFRPAVSRRHHCGLFARPRASLRQHRRPQIRHPKSTHRKRPDRWRSFLGIHAWLRRQLSSANLGVPRHRYSTVRIRPGSSSRRERTSPRAWMQSCCSWC